MSNVNPPGISGDDPVPKITWHNFTYKPRPKGYRYWRARANGDVGVALRPPYRFTEDYISGVIWCDTKRDIVRRVNESGKIEMIDVPGLIFMDATVAVLCDDALMRELEQYR